MNITDNNNKNLIFEKQEPYKALVFTGAGIGCPLGLKVTKDFTDTINAACRNIISDLRDYGQDTNCKDIEVVLPLLDAIRDDGNFWYRWMGRHRSEAYAGATYSQISSIREQAEEAGTDLKRRLFDILDEFDPQAAANLYYHLIDEIKDVQRPPGADVAVSIFTANYDLTFEGAYDVMAEELEEGSGVTDVDYGFSLKRQKYIFDPKKHYAWDPEIIEYKKIHGSFDWVMRNGKCVRGEKVVPSDPNSMPLLYPGFKGTPDKEPFISLHGQFFTRMMEADLIIFIGFAFRDPYINTLIDMALSSSGRNNKRVLCYNPAPLDSLPKESRLPYFTARYGNMFHHIEKGIELKENPLELLNELEKFV